MRHTYVAYKREDEIRVALLVEALRLKGLEVWFDAALPGGEDWRRQLAAQLEPAGCVLVVWSRLSVDLEAGVWVQEEAQHGLNRNILVPVILDPVLPPLGFGRTQSFDLTRWRGDLNDPAFLDVVGAIEAKLDGRQSPPSKSRGAMLKRRLIYAALSTAGAAAMWAMIFNTFGAAENICTFEGLQPGLSDACGTLHIGNRPTHEERLAWSARKPGDCEALGEHIRRFPYGVYAQVASNLLTARHSSIRDEWTQTERTLPLFEGTEGPVAIDEAAGRNEAITRAKAAAQRQCEAFGAGTLYRFISADARASVWHCRASSGGVVCGLEGDAICKLDLHQPREELSCGD